MNPDVIIRKLNESVVEIDTTDDINHNIYTRYSEYVPGYQFNPAYKLRRFDGKFHAYNIKTNILPIGLVKDLISYLVAQKTTFQLEGFRDLELCEPLDEEKYTAQIKDNMKNAPFEIREYQDRAVRAALKYHRGILLSCTSSGKSLMLYNIIKSIRAQNYKKILLIVPNIMLVDQMYDDFKSYGWQQIEDEVERLGGGHEATFDCPVLISTWQSLQNKEEEFFEPFDAVFVDEVHSVKRKSIKSVSKNMCKCKI